MELSVEIEGADELMLGILSATAGKELLRKLWRILRSWSFQMERLIKIAMPVLTGRARASWGHWTKGDTDNPQATEDDAHWLEDESNLTIEQGSNVVYVPRLNEGHSQQAPAGFIDKIFRQVREGLLAEVAEAIEDWARR